MPQVTCKHCGRVWDYCGESKVTATCPDCQKKTPIKGEEKKERTHGR